MIEFLSKHNSIVHRVIVQLLLYSQFKSELNFKFYQIYYVPHILDTINSISAENKNFIDTLENNNSKYNNIILLL